MVAACFLSMIAVQAHDLSHDLCVVGKDTVTPPKTSKRAINSFPRCCCCSLRSYVQSLFDEWVQPDVHCSRHSLLFLRTPYDTRRGIMLHQSLAARNALTVSRAWLWTLLSGSEDSSAVPRAIAATATRRGNSGEPWPTLRRRF